MADDGAAIACARPEVSRRAFEGRRANRKPARKRVRRAGGDGDGGSAGGSGSGSGSESGAGSISGDDLSGDGLSGDDVSLPAPHGRRGQHSRSSKVVGIATCGVDEYASTDESGIDDNESGIDDADYSGDDSGDDYGDDDSAFAIERYGGAEEDDDGYSMSSESECSKESDVENDGVSQKWVLRFCGKEAKGAGKEADGFGSCTVVHFDKWQEAAK